MPASLAVGAGVVPVSYEPLWGWLLFYEWAAACFCLIMGAQLRHSFLAGALPLQRPCRSGAVQHPCGFCTASAETRLWCSLVAWSWAVPAALGQCIAAAFRHTAPQPPSKLGAGVCVEITNHVAGRRPVTSCSATRNIVRVGNRRLARTAGRIRPATGKHHRYATVTMAQILRWVG